MAGGCSYTSHYTTADGWGLKLHLLLHYGRSLGVTVTLIITLRRMAGGCSYTSHYTTADGWGLQLHLLLHDGRWLGVVVTLWCPWWAARPTAGACWGTCPRRTSPAAGGPAGEGRVPPSPPAPPPGAWGASHSRRQQQRTARDDSVGGWLAGA